MPLTNTTVVPAGWAAHQRPVTTAAMGGVCSLARPGGTGKSFNSGTGTTSDTPNTPYVTGVRCDVMSTGAVDAASMFGDQLAATLDLVATLDWSTAGTADLRINDLLTVTAVDGNGNPDLVGRLLRVAGISRATAVWDRTVGLVDTQF